MKRVKRSGSVAWSAGLVALASASASAMGGATQPPSPPAGLVHLLVTERCSATLITDRAAVTSAACVFGEGSATPGWDWQRVEFRQVVDPEGRRLSGRVIPFMPAGHLLPQRARSGVGDLALVLFDEAFPVVGQSHPAGAIPTYWSEYLLQASPVGRRAGYLGKALPRETLDQVTPVTVYGRNDWPLSKLPSGLTMDKFGSVLRSFPVARSEEPDLYGDALVDLVQADLNMRFSDEELADVVMPAPSLLGLDGPVGTRKTRDGEWGAGIYAHDGDDEVLVGLVGKAAYQIRLSNYWPWIFKTLLQNDRVDEALAVADRVLETHPGRRLTDTHKCTQVGQLYADKSAVDIKAGTMPFHRLMQHPFRQGREGVKFMEACSSYATAGEPGSAWEPLGTRLPSATEGRRITFSWYYHGGSAQGGEPFIGGYYGYLNRTNAKREFFQLKAPLANGRLAYFPLDGRSNAHWDYVGEQLPPVRAMRLLDPRSSAR